MTDRELMQKALEALEPYAILYGHIQQVVTALRERLAQPEPAPGYCQHCKQYTIEEPLPAQPEQEPVVGEYATCLEDGERVLIASVLPVGYGGNKTRTVRVVWSDGTDGVYTLFQFAKLFAPLNTPTTPPRREWVGLTDEECIAAIDEDFNFALDHGNVSDRSVIRYARAIEAKLREKNS